jgi:Fe-S-cluster containining protein
MDICAKSNCVVCCRKAEVALLNEDVNRISMHGYYDAYFTFETDGIKILRTFSDGGCIFFNKNTGSCEIYDYRPEQCRLRPYTTNDGTDSAIIDDTCKHCSDCISEADKENDFSKFITKLREEIAWRKKTGYF